MIIEEKDITDQNDEPLIYTVSDLADAVAEAIAKEREACARIAEEFVTLTKYVEDRIAAAIRARGDA